MPTSVTRWRCVECGARNAPMRTACSSCSGRRPRYLKVVVPEGTPMLRDPGTVAAPSLPSPVLSRTVSAQDARVQGRHTWSPLSPKYSASEAVGDTPRVQRPTIVTERRYQCTNESCDGKDYTLRRHLLNAPQVKAAAAAVYTRYYYCQTPSAEPVTHQSLFRPAGVHCAHGLRQDQGCNTNHSGGCTAPHQGPDRPGCPL